MSTKVTFAYYVGMCLLQRKWLCKYSHARPYKHTKEKMIYIKDYKGMQSQNELIVLTIMNNFYYGNHIKNWFGPIVKKHNNEYLLWTLFGLAHLFLYTLFIFEWTSLPVAFLTLRCLMAALLSDREISGSNSSLSGFVFGKQRDVGSGTMTKFDPILLLLSHYHSRWSKF